MERSVKERLIGAAVLVAAAIILIPEMLSGRGERALREEQAATEVRSQGGIKTYTIDLNQPPGTAATRVDAEPAPAPIVPPPEQVAQSAPITVSPEPVAQPEPSTTQVRPRETAPTPAPTPRPAPAPTTPPRAAATPAPAPQPVRPAAQPAPRTEPARPAASTSASGWAVQLGSFSKQATADALMREWRGRGQQAFVMPVRSGSTTLYRVRIGPMQNREAAEAVLLRVRPTVPAAAVVAHP